MSDDGIAGEQQDFRVQTGARCPYAFSMKPCVICGAALKGRQRKFCSRSCKNQFGNTRYQSYIAQQARGKARKLRLVQLFGSQCSKCGYDRNLSALEFHHTDHETKQFNLDLRSLSNRTWSAVVCESSKCILLCAKCHKEFHFPEGNMHENKSRAMPGF